MGGKHATTTSKVTIPPEVLARYNAVNARAENAASAPFRAFGNTASDYVAQMNAQQNAGIDDINATAGSYQPYMTQATAATQAGMGPAYAGIDNYMSPYIKNVADTTGAMMKQQYEQAQSGALGTAASSGAFGGDRAGIAAANMQQQNQMGYGNTMANIYNQGYTQALGASQQDLARQLQGGSQMAQLGAQSQQLGLQGAQAKIAAGTMQQQTEQAGKDAMIQRFMQEQGYPFQTAQFLANIAMGTGAAQGSTTTTSTPRSVFGFAQGGGVAGPRTYSQGTIGGDGYVPVGDLPVGQLMVAQPPEQQQGSGNEDVVKLITSMMGAKHGGVIDARHGYATDGGVHPTHWNPVTQKYEVEPVTTGVVAPDAPVVPPTTTSNGVVPRLHPDQQPDRGIPLLTQAAYGMSEPEFKRYRSHQYGSPAEAAVGANNYYEGAGEGVGDAAAIENANRVYAAIKNGGEGLAPNELALYDYYKKNGFNDDTQVAGLIGRFNVEAGSGINPNARNDIGGGHGTYGIMQARGPRFEKLAAAGGLSAADLEAMPVTNGLSSGVSGGENLKTSVSTMGAPDQQYEGGVKPYEDRNFIGKFFHNRNGSMNSDAIMSLLGGLGSMAQAQTISPIGAILAGLGGGMETYKQLLKQSPEVTKANIENSDSFQRLYLRAVEGFGYKGTPEEYAREIGYRGPMPYGGGADMGAAPNTEQRTYKGAVLDPFGRGLTQDIELPNVGRVQAGQVYGYLKNLEAEMQRSQSLGITVDPQALADLRAKIAAHTGQIQTENGPVEDPTYTEALFGAGATVRDAEQSNAIAVAIPENLTASREAVRNTDELARALETMPSTGPISPWYAGAQGIAGQLGLTEDLDYATAMQISGKSIAEQARSAVASLAGTADTSMVRELVEQSTPRGTMTPKAIEELLAIRAGAAAYNEAYNQVAADALAQDPAANVAEVQRKFTQDHKPTDYIEDMRPKYRGMFVPDSASALGITQEEWRNLPAAKRQAFLN